MKELPAATPGPKQDESPSASEEIRRIEAIQQSVGQRRPAFSAGRSGRAPSPSAAGQHGLGCQAKAASGLWQEFVSHPEFACSAQRHLPSGLELVDTIECRRITFRFRKGSLDRPFVLRLDILLKNDILLESKNKEDSENSDYPQ